MELIALEYAGQWQLMLLQQELLSNFVLSSS